MGLTKKPVFNINVEILRTMPIHGYIFWKNIEGLYMGSNEIMMEHCNISSYRDILTKTDYDLPWQEAELFRKEDKLVMQQRRAMQFCDQATFSGFEVKLLTLKTPLINQDNEVVGVFGFSQITEELKINESFSYLAEAGVPTTILKNISTHLVKQSNILLSKRQLDCLEYLSKGMSMKEIANQLGLSPRTVEHHIEALKAKLKCNKRSELFAKAKNYLNGGHA